MKLTIHSSQYKPLPALLYKLPIVAVPIPSHQLSQDIQQEEPLISMTLLLALS
jgi:hypothetical protein